MRTTLIFLSLLFVFNGIHSISLKNAFKKTTQNGQIIITVDNTLDQIQINGESITLNAGNEGTWTATKTYSAALTGGDTVEIFCTNTDGPGGVLATLKYTDADGVSQEVSTGSDWTCGGVAATVEGLNGVSPWGAFSSISSNANWIWDPNVGVGSTSCKVVLPGASQATQQSNVWTAKLTWGAAVKDVDILAVLPSGKKVYYRNKKSGNVVLDVDDTDGTGPETLTFNSVESGTYQIWVQAYSREAAITESGAQVVVSRGDNLVETFTVPTSGSGKDFWWHVCDFNADSGSLETVNTVSTAFGA